MAIVSCSDGNLHLETCDLSQLSSSPLFSLSCPDTQSTLCVKI